MSIAKFVTLRVADVQEIAPTLKQVTFVKSDGGLLPTSMPGAHITLSIKGKDKIHRNSYSLIGAPDCRDAYQIIVRRLDNSRGGSAFVHDQLQVGDVLDATFPNSQFCLQSKAKRHLLIGGGVGVTPFLSFLSAFREQTVPIEFHQFARAAEVPFFEKLLAPFHGVRTTVHGGPAHRIAEILERQPLGTHVYTCGPTKLMDDVLDSARRRGWPEANLHLESFGGAGGAPFEIELARSGRTISVGEHETMLEAMEAAGMDAPSLCRGGACGECVTRVIAGSPDHRDHFLTAAEKSEGKLVMPCVSRSLSPALVLDL